MTIITEGSKSNYSDRIAAIGAIALDPPSASTLRDKFGHAAIDQAQDALKEAAIKKGTKEVAKLLGPFGFLAGFAADAIGDRIKEYNHNKATLKGIEELSKQQVPGIAFKEVEIDGDKHRIGIDASGQVGNSDAESRVIIERSNSMTIDANGNQSSSSSRIDLKDPALAAHINALKNVANSSMEAYKQDIAQKLPEEKKKYRAEMSDYLEKIDAADADSIATLTPPSNPLGPETRYGVLLNEAIENAEVASLKNDKNLTLQRTPPAQPEQQMAFNN